MMDTKMNSLPKNDSKACRECREHLSDLLLDPAAVPAAVNTHLSACADCAAELQELNATFALMDDWTAPEPSPFFDTRLHAQLRAVQAEAPEGFWARLRDRMLFNTGRNFRPAMAGALALVILAGGGSYLGVHGLHGTQAPQASATVNDLKILDNNVQALQQMDQLLDDTSDDSDDGSTT